MPTLLHRRLLVEASNRVGVRCQRPNGAIATGTLRGAKLRFPHVALSDAESYEISWDLAERAVLSRATVLL